MNEAKYSFNIRFNLSGYDCQFTVRSEEEPGIETLKKVPSIIAELEKLGAVGERRWEKVRNGGQETQAKPHPRSDEPAAGPEFGPTAPAHVVAEARDAKATGVIAMDEEASCPLCGAIGELDLIGFMRGKAYKQAWKCQACGKWIPDGTVTQ